MEGTSTEIEHHSVSIDMDDDDDDLIFNVSPCFASIRATLETFSPQPSECCIYRVPWRLRKVNEEAYTPDSISIGPFHHDNERFQNMEECKLKYLKAFLVRTGRSLAYHLKTVQRWEQRARGYYSETINLSSDEFVKMILVDGSFIVEFLLRGDEQDPIFNKLWMFGIVFSDMILLENQLPFFVLESFYNSVNAAQSPLLELVHTCCCRISRLPGTRSTRKPKHLVDYIHHVYVSSIPEEQGQHVSSIPDEQQQHARKYERPPTVTQLHQAGIKFKKGTSISLFDIKFSNNGILEIPQLDIHGLTGSWFQNLIAFEQCHGIQKCIFSHYFVLLDGMIDTSKDADLLIHSKIIRNLLSSSEEVSTLFNNIGKEVVVDPTDFHFSKLCQELNAYCKSPWHKRMATLRREYFSTPWAVISFIAAVLLIVLTAIQSICSIISL